MAELTDDLLISKLKAEGSAAYELLYKFHFPSIVNFIRKNSGTAQDAEDIFQETIIILLGKVRQPEFVLTSSLKTFLFAIAKNLWLKKLQANKNQNINLEKMMAEGQEPEGEKAELANEERLTTWLQRITIHCQRILQAIFFLNEPMDSLMQKMGWKNKHTAANQKYKCIEQVRKESTK
jgi:RNA polymerase sigma factor (sigma-70 family)